MVTETTQLSLLDQQHPRATGDLWNPVPGTPTTVPVVVVRIDGPFTALDRKLWLALVRHAWDNLDKPGHIHEVPIGEIAALFRKVTGRRDLGTTGTVQLTERTSEESEAAKLWSSVRRLAKTTIEWQDDDYMGINSLLGARMDRKARAGGKLYFTFDPLLAQHVLAPRAWARLNVHVVMQLRSKYAVTLYEILEGYANRETKVCTATLEEVRRWLKVPEESSYSSWKDFRRRVLDSAVQEINDHADEAGFMVAYEGLREGNAFSKIRFDVTKTAGRTQRETQLGRKARIHKRRRHATLGLGDPDHPPEPSADALDSFRRKWPGHDPYEVIGRFQDKWRNDGCVTLRSPDGAFLKWLNSRKACSSTGQRANRAGRRCQVHIPTRRTDVISWCAAVWGVRPCACVDRRAESKI